MNKQVYSEKKTFIKYDNEHYLLYLNEENVEYTPQIEENEKSTPIPGYSYTGDMEDGGTLVEAKSATYSEFVNGLIRKRYDASAESAIQSNRLVALIEPEHERSDEYIADWNDFQDYRELCKRQAKAVLE